MHPLFPIVERISEIHEVDKFLIAAIADQESKWDTYAIRYEPGFPYLVNVYEWAKATSVSMATEKIGQQTSWGLCQVMGSTARWLGFRGDFPQLCDPEVGITYGCLYVKKLKERFTRLSDIVSAYNAGTPKMVGDKYKNQEYVDRVLSNYERFKAGK
jgi:soluble lytic murein transglycosylase-like protein